MCKKRRTSGRAGAAGKERAAEDDVSGMATDGMSRANNNKTNENNMDRINTNVNPGYPQVGVQLGQLGYAGHPYGYAGHPYGYAGHPYGYAGHAAYPGFPGSGWAPGVQPHRYPAASPPADAKAEAAVEGEKTQYKKPIYTPQAMKPLVKRGHGTSQNELNRSIREQIRNQQSKGNVVVKVEPKLRSSPKYNAPRLRNSADNKKISRMHAAQDDAAVYLPPDTAALNAAIIMASTPGIVVEGSSKPLPKINLEESTRPEASASEQDEPTTLDTTEAAARVAEALIGLRGASGLQDCLEPLSNQKEDEYPGCA